MKKLWSLTLALLFGVGAMLSVGVQPVLAEDSGYRITAYDVNIVIGEDNTYQVTEHLTVDYSEERHGFIRAIPYRQMMDWNINGESLSRIYNTPVRNVEVVGAPFTTYKENNLLMIQIGDPDQYVTGTQDYTVSYQHVLGNDKIDSLDFVYYNLIGTDWDCSIDNVSFSVTLPKDFDASGIHFYSGAYGSSGEDLVDYQTAGRTITGTHLGPLAPYEGLTLKLRLPEGYFAVSDVFNWTNLLYLLTALFLLGAVFLFLRFGKDGKLVTPVEFNAPEGITPAEAGYIIDTDLEDKDVVSLILYWAAGGYLSIERLDKEDFQFRKLQDLPQTAAKYEKTMFSGLFEGRNEVSTAELKNTFYETVLLTKELIIEHYAVKENRLYNNFSRALGWLVRFSALFLTWLALFAASYNLIYYVPVAIAVSIIGALLVALPFFLDRPDQPALAGYQAAAKVGRLTLCLDLYRRNDVALCCLYDHLPVALGGYSGSVYRHSAQSDGDFYAQTHPARQ